VLYLPRQISHIGFDQMSRDHKGLYLDMAFSNNIELGSVFFSALIDL
jgi:hypothetical protein